MQYTRKTVQETENTHNRTYATNRQTLWNTCARQAGNRRARKTQHNQHNNIDAQHTQSGQATLERRRKHNNNRHTHAQQRKEHAQTNKLTQQTHKHTPYNNLKTHTTNTDKHTHNTHTTHTQQRNHTNTHTERGKEHRHDTQTPTAHS